MNSIEFGKKCRFYNIQYRNIFGYIPCHKDYRCSQEEYFNALIKAIETKTEISTFVPKKNINYQNLNKRYWYVTNWQAGGYEEKSVNRNDWKINRYRI